MNRNPVADNTVNVHHNITGFASKKILNDFMMINDRVQEKEAAKDCIRPPYKAGDISVLMNHGMGPRPNRKADMNTQRINSRDILHGESAYVSEYRIILA